MKEELKNIKHAITLLQKAVAGLEGRLAVDTPKKQSRFNIPPWKICSQHHKDEKYTFDLEEWYNHYESNGWKVGRVVMKSWKACMAQWQSRHKKDNPERTKYQLDASGRPIIQNGNGQLL